MIEPDQLILGDCIEKMQEIPDEKIGCVICDLPYSTGSTACSWDKKTVPLEPLWEQYKRIVKRDRAIVLFASQPFTSKLIMSNMQMFKYTYTWYKHSAPNFVNSHTMPLKVTEDICVFGFKPVSYNKKGEYILYNPQFSKGKPYKCITGKQRKDTALIRDREDAKTKTGGVLIESDGRRYPTTLLDFTKDKTRYHPTQKPVNLLRYLIRTYSNEGDVILDNTAGSMSTAIAAIRENRRYIMIEKDPSIFAIGKARVEEELRNTSLF